MNNYTNAQKERRQALQEIVDNINRARELLGIDGRLKLEFTIPESVVAASGALTSIGGLGYCIYAGGKTGISAAGLTSGLKSLGRFVGGMKGGIALIAAIPLAATFGCLHYAQRVNNKQLSEETKSVLHEVHYTLDMIDLALVGRHPRKTDLTDELTEIREYLTEAATMLRFFVESDPYRQDVTYSPDEVPVFH